MKCMHFRCIHTHTVTKLSFHSFPVFSPALHSLDFMLWACLQLLLGTKFMFLTFHSSSTHSGKCLLNTFNVLRMCFSFQRFRYVPLYLALLTSLCNEIMRSTALVADIYGTTLYFLDTFLARKTFAKHSTANWTTLKCSTEVLMWSKHHDCRVEEG